jgi:hypothetical protein
VFAGRALPGSCIGVVKLASAGVAPVRSKIHTASFPATQDVMRYC